MMVDLLNCPFCGSAPVPDFCSSEDPVYLVHCQSEDCPAWPNVRGNTEAEAIAAWNSRAEPPKPETPKPIVAGASEDVVERVAVVTWLKKEALRLCQDAAHEDERSSFARGVGYAKSSALDDAAASIRDGAVAAMRPDPLMDEVREMLLVAANLPSNDRQMRERCRDMARALLAKLGD